MTPKKTNMKIMPPNPSGAFCEAQKGVAHRYSPPSLAEAGQLDIPLQAGGDMPTLEIDDASFEAMMDAMAIERDSSG